MAPRYRLKLSKLDFVSAVDTPAQPTATVAIIKRDESDEIVAQCRVAKVDAELGIVMGWAFTSTVDGAAFFDLQGDAIDENQIVKVAADFMLAGGASDEMHDGDGTGRVVFCWPLTAEIAKALDIACDKTGLLVGIKPAADVLAKFVDGTYSGFSIAGTGEREQVAKMKCAKCSAYAAKGDVKCAKCGAMLPTKRAPIGKATWTTAYVDDLADSAFLYVEPGGSKDSDGKTTPRSLRHFPYKDVNGKIDIAHLRDATGRIPQSSLAASLKEKLQQKAEKILAAQHTDKRAGDVSKHAYLTTAVAGHVHILDHDNGQAAGYTDYAQDASGNYHQHPWVRPSDPDGSGSGSFVLGEADGHVHQVVSQDQIDALAASGAEVDEAATTSVAKREEQVMDPKLEKITKDPAKFAKKLEDAEAEIERWKAKYSMTDAQREVYKAFSKDEDKADFLAKSHAERDELVAKANQANPIVVELDGVQYRKNDDPRLIQMAKRSKEQADALAKRDAELEHAKLEKRVSTEMQYLPGEAPAKVALLKAALAIADEPTRNAALQILAAHNTAMKAAFATVGHVAKTGENATLEQQLEQLAQTTKLNAEKVGKSMSIEEARGAVMGTPEGRALYNQIEIAKRAVPSPN